MGVGRGKVFPFVRGHGTNIARICGLVLIYYLLLKTLVFMALKIHLDKRYPSSGLYHFISQCFFSQAYRWQPSGEPTEIFKMNVVLFQGQAIN